MNYYVQIKDKLLNNEIRKKAKDYSKNVSDLSTYYEVGKLIVEAQGGEERAKYGDRLIKGYALNLTRDLGKGYTTSSLKRMRQFFLIIQKGATMSHLSTWSHYVELLKFDGINEINYYIDISVKQNLSVRELRHKIKNNEYERLPEATKNKLKEKEKPKVNDFIKNPIVIKNSYDKDEITEGMLKQLILENISDFLLELGEGFCFIKDEYKIKLGDRYNYIDLLLFNIKYNSYAVIELKVTELRKEHIGQIQEYMNYIDKNIKQLAHQKTIGIIIAKKNNKYVIEYCSDDRIYASTYILN